MPLRDHGNVSGLVCTVQEVTQRKELEQEILERYAARDEAGLLLPGLDKDGEALSFELLYNAGSPQTEPLRPVVASGGITELADLEALMGLVDEGVEGAIIGTALYEGRFTLEDALALTKPGAGAAS